MAMSLHVEGCVQRFLSPTRFGHSRNIHQDKHQAVRMNFGKQMQIKRSALKKLTLSDGHYKRSFSVHKYFVPTVQTVWSSAKNAKDTVKLWSNKKITDLDNSSVSRLIAALNLDIPKFSIPILQSSGIKQTVCHQNEKQRLSNSKEENKVCVSAELDPSIDHSESTIAYGLPQNQDRENNDKINIPHVVKQKTPNYWSEIEYAMPSVLREQHDFYEAMTSKYESISSFHGDKVSTKINSDSSQNAISNNRVLSTSKQDDELSSSQVGIGTSLLQKINTNLPSMDFLPHLHFRINPQPKKDKKQTIESKKSMSKAAVDRHVKSLITSLKCARELPSRLVRLEDLCSYLLEHPGSRGVAFQERIIPLLLTWKECKDATLLEQIHEALAMLGYVEPVKGHGIRVLSLDGGGTRGLVSIRILRQLEKLCNKKLYEVFDYVCGVSTGSLIATMLFVYKIPLEEIENVYREFSRKVFSRTRAMGTVQLVRNHSYYDSKLWEEILKFHVGAMSACESARDPTCPKLSTISSIINVQKVQNYIFRNYDYPQGVGSNYKGSMKFMLWEAVKASSAAPGYFEECKYGDLVHQDGGVLTNNPTAIAIHECKLLWPREPLQCVVSVGTGRHELELDPLRTPEYSGLKEKLDKIIQSATDTEAVHLTVENLLQPSTYFRLNPFLYENITLDEIRDHQWERMGKDTDIYCKRNRPKLMKMSQKLMEPRKTRQKINDWYKQNADKHDLSLNLPYFGSKDK